MGNTALECRDAIEYISSIALHRRRLHGPRLVRSGARKRADQPRALRSPGHRGAVAARGRTPAELSAAIAARLRDGYIRHPYVAAEVEAYRPFFILGEVAAPGQYPFVPNMTAESAVAIAGGFSPRARRDHVTITHTDARGTVRLVVPTATLLSPGDTVLVDERWF